MSNKQRDVDALPTFPFSKFEPSFDPRTLPHYCVHSKVFYPDILYFNEFEAHLDNNSNVSLGDLSFLFGLFMFRMSDAHRKVTNFANAIKPKSLQQLINYVISLNTSSKHTTFFILKIQFQLKPNHKLFHFYIVSITSTTTKDIHRF